MQVSVVIAHAAFLTERKYTLQHLVDQLHESDIEPKVFQSNRPEHSSVWALRCWNWASHYGRAFTVFLNDDVILCPNFGAVLQTVLELLPQGVPQKIALSLHSAHPEGPRIVKEGHRFLRSYMLSGPAYAESHAFLEAKLEWLAKTPRSLREQMHEDNVTNQFAFSTKNPIWATLPALTRHDLTVKSSLGFDDRPYRSASVPFSGYEKMTQSDFWTPSYWHKIEKAAAGFFTLTDSDAPYVPCPWLSDEGFEEMDRAIRQSYTGVTRDRLCAFCKDRVGIVQSVINDASVCGPCLGVLTQSVLSQMKS